MVSTMKIATLIASLGMVGAQFVPVVAAADSKNDKGKTTTVVTSNSGNSNVGNNGKNNTGATGGSAGGVNNPDDRDAQGDKKGKGDDKGKGDGDDKDHGYGDGDRDDHGKNPPTIQDLLAQVNLTLDQLLALPFNKLQSLFHKIFGDN